MDDGGQDEDDDRRSQIGDWEVSASPPERHPGAMAIRRIGHHRIRDLVQDVYEIPDGRVPRSAIAPASGMTIAGGSVHTY